MLHITMPQHFKVSPKTTVLRTMVPIRSTYSEFFGVCPVAVVNALMLSSKFVPYMI